MTRSGSWTTYDGHAAKLRPDSTRSARQFSLPLSKPWLEIPLRAHAQEGQRRLEKHVGRDQYHDLWDQHCVTATSGCTARRQGLPAPTSEGATLDPNLTLVRDRRELVAVG